MILAASATEIPDIDADENYFLLVEKADLEDTDLVVGLLIGSESRACPVRFLSSQEMIVDRVGGKAFRGDSRTNYQNIELSILIL